MTDTLDPVLTDAAHHAHAMLTELGAVGDERTGRRLATALHQLTWARDLDPARHLQVTFPPESDQPGLIAVHGIPFTSVCAHHILPFWGTASVAYLPYPGARIVGLSKLARLVQETAARPQVQERITNQVITAITTALHPRGAAVVLHGTHTCMALRGATTGVNAVMTTPEYRGELSAGTWRDEFNRRALPAAG